MSTSIIQLLTETNKTIYTRDPIEPEKGSMKAVLNTNNLFNASQCNETNYTNFDNNKYESLEKLKKLYDDKVLTKEEYEKEKNKILNGLN